MTEKNKMRAPSGRPSSFTQEIADEICGQLAGGRSLVEICRADTMPSEMTVYRWLRRDETFRAQYVQAREDQADHLADEILEIADDGRNDWMERNRGEDAPSMAVDSEHIQRSRLRIDTRKWLMSKVAPKKYGDRLSQELSGPDGGPIMVAPVSDMDRAKALAAFLAKTKTLTRPEP